jgi:hypothetical protein
MRYSLLLLVAAVCLCQDASDPWSKSEFIQPATLAQEILAKQKPVILSVAFPVLYRNKHIARAIDAGPGSKPEGIALLKKDVAGLPKNADIVLYCGCCPMVKCPYVRPAYKVLKEMGFTHIRVLDIATNTNTDWFSKGYPSELGPAAQAATP